jgi:hypothetical protein
MNESPDEDFRAAVYRVSVRLPPFWPDRPAVSFAQIEAQFDLVGIICQRTKFNYVVSQLNQQQAAKVEDISSPPDLDPSEWLKAELMRRLSTSREQRVGQLISHEEMGERSHHSSYGTKRAWHLSSQTIFFAPSAPTVYHHKYKRFSPARRRAV